MAVAIVETGEPVGTQAQLACGHRIRLPWSLPPEAAVAVLLEHQDRCLEDSEGPVPRGMVFQEAAWLPFPEVVR
jgi:hypothetical protein